MSNRIRIAEMIGGPIWEAYINPGVHPEFVRLPDPENDANDCEALIGWLNSESYEVDILHWEEGDSTVIVKRSIETTGKRFHSEVTSPNWKQGVCELVLKEFA